MAAEDDYVFGDFRLCVARRTLVHRTSGPVAITSRVFDTLAHLVRHAGELVSKRELLTAVWGGVVVEENNLTQAISALRQLLGEKPDDHRYIVTVPGRGYRFVAAVSRAPDMDAVRDGLARPEVAPAGTEAVPANVGDGQPTKAASRPGARPDWRAWVGAVLALCGVLGAAFWLRSGPSPQQTAIEQIAVLPFKPLVAEAADPALEIGMADSLILRLSSSGGIVVRPLGSVRRYATLDQDPVAAGRELAVDAVLDGSVHRAGDTLRVTARLIRVSDGTALWVDSVDQHWTDLFGVQDRIAERVVDALSVTLKGAERERLHRRYTQNEAAYRLYLLGRYHWLRLTPPEVTRAIGYFEQAIDEDPTYALAYAGLAESYRTLAITSDRRPADVLPLGRSAALQAIAIDDRLDSAWASLCFIQIWWDWDWPAAAQSCRRALAINPNSADGHRAYAILLSDLGRHDEAMAHAHRASELDPLSHITTAIEGHVLFYAGRSDESMRRLRATLDLDPGFWIAHLFLGKVQLGSGRLQDALAEFELAAKLSGGNSEAVSLIGYTLARSGDRKGAEAALAELQSRQPARYVPPFNIAMIHHGLGEVDQTFAWLERAYAERDVRLTFLKIERKWDALRSDPRFVSLARRMRLDQG